MTQLDHLSHWLSTSILPDEPSLRRWLEQERMRGIEGDDVIQDTYAQLARLESVAAIHQEPTQAAVTLDGLPLRCREVFVLRKIHGLSQREVATRLAIPEGTVEKHVHKALQRLKGVAGGWRKTSGRASKRGTTPRDRQRI